MPKSNGRPLARAPRRQLQPTSRRQPKAHSDSAIADQELRDRRDYRQTLIHRLSTAHAQRKETLEQNLALVESQIRTLAAGAKAA